MKTIIFNDNNLTDNDIEMRVVRVKGLMFNSSGKILLAHNTRPKASQQQEFQGKYHDNEVSCSAYSKNRSRRIYVDTVVRGGNYKTVFFKDDTQKSYERLFNATSKRLD